AIMCDECGVRPANIHLTTIVNGEKIEKNLCAACMAKNKSIKIDFSALAGQLSGFMEALKAGGEPKQPEPDIKCSRCGMSYATFKKIGLLGCAHCYQEFREPLTQLLGRIHGNAQHAGRVPGGEDSSLSLKMNLERLRQDLVRAIADEEYEAAAGLRDRIRALNAQLARSAAPKAETMPEQNPQPLPEEGSHES
ncbi:MAG: hypothetical protein GX558_11665, partial [Clostridiales bacterium]|nr:hypothetical protein [Clostridiales bacterium]